MKRILLLAGILMTATLISCGEKGSEDKDESEKAEKNSSEDLNNDGELTAADATDEMWEKGLEQCITQAKKSMGAAGDAFDEDALNEAVEDYCSCSMDAMKEADMSISDMYDQAKIMEVAADCIQEFQDEIQAMMLGE